jgi:hypothetical protein
MIVGRTPELNWNMNVLESVSCERESECWRCDDCCFDARVSNPCARRNVVA